MPCLPCLKVNAPA